MTCSLFKLENWSYIKSVEISESSSGIEHLTVLGNEGEFRVWGSKLGRSHSWSFTRAQPLIGFIGKADQKVNYLGVVIFNSNCEAFKPKIPLEEDLEETKDP